MLTWMAQVPSDTSPLFIERQLGISTFANLNKLGAQRVLSETEKRFDFLNMNKACSEPQERTKLVRAGPG